MIEKNMAISCNGKVIASHILIPESSKEKEHGMRERKAEAGTAMLFIFPKNGLLLFNMWGVRNPLGIMALDVDKKILYTGIMKPWIGGFLGWGRYVLEVVPEMLKDLKREDIVSW